MDETPNDSTPNFTPGPASPAELKYDYRRNVTLDLVLTVALCLMWNVVVQYHQCDTFNALLKREKYSFWRFWIFSVLTCGAYLVYHEYQKSKDWQEISGKQDDSDQVLAVVLAIFGLNFIYDAILQTKINEYLDRFPAK